MGSTSINILTGSVSSFGTNGDTITDIFTDFVTNNDQKSNDVYPNGSYTYFSRMR